MSRRFIYLRWSGREDPKDPFSNSTGLYQLVQEVGRLVGNNDSPTMSCGSDTSTIYKILTTEQWHAFQQAEIFAGTPLDQDDGYIHMSYQAQVAQTHKKFFGGSKDVVLVHVDSTLIDPVTLVPETNRGGTAVYPHIYGTIPLAAVIKTEPL